MKRSLEAKDCTERDPKRCKTTEFFVAVVGHCSKGGGEDQGILSVDTFSLEKTASEHVVDLALPVLMHDVERLKCSESGSDSDSNSGTDDDEENDQNFRFDVGYSFITCNGDKISLLREIKEHIRTHAWPMNLSVEKVSFSGPRETKAVALIVRERFKVLGIEGVADLPEAKVIGVVGYPVEPGVPNKEAHAVALASQAKTVMDTFCITGHMHLVLSCVISLGKKHANLETDSESESDPESDSEDKAVFGPVSRGKRAVESCLALVELIAASKSGQIKSDHELFEGLNRVMDWPSGEFNRVSVTQVWL